MLRGNGFSKGQMPVLMSDNFQLLSSGRVAFTQVFDDKIFLCLQGLIRKCVLALQ